MATSTAPKLLQFLTDVFLPKEMKRKIAGRRKKNCEKLPNRRNERANHKQNVETQVSGKKLGQCENKSQKKYGEK
jgi:hypothetical protein